MKKFLTLFAIAAAVVAASCSKPADGTGVPNAPRLNKTELTLMVGEKETLKVENTKLAPSFSSADTKIATVNGRSGLVTAKSVGQTVITAKVGDAELKCNVTVTPKENIVTGITVTPSAITLNEGGTGNLKAEITPSDADDYATVAATLKWSSSDESVATVDKDGKVTAKAVAEGQTKEAIITANVTGKNRELSGSCTVTVTSNVVKTTGIQLSTNSLTLVPDGSGKFTFSFTPANHTDSPEVNVVSGDTGVATVSVSGNEVTVTGKADGSAAVTVSLKGNADINASCSVLVKEGDKAGTCIDMSNTYFPYTWGSGLANMEEITLECWMYTSALSADSQNGDQSLLGTEGVFLIREELGKPQACIGGGSSSGWTGTTETKVEDPTVKLTVNEWTHIAGTYSASEKKAILYVNGVKIADAASKLDGALPMNGYENYYGFMVGAGYQYGRFLKGSIAYARVWNVVRTADEIAANMGKKNPTGSGLIANWYFDEGTGNTITDHSSTGANLTPKSGNIVWKTALEGGTVPPVK